MFIYRQKPRAVTPARRNTYACHLRGNITNENGLAVAVTPKIDRYMWEAAPHEVVLKRREHFSPNFAALNFSIFGRCAVRPPFEVKYRGPVADISRWSEFNRNNGRAVRVCFKLGKKRSREDITDSSSRPAVASVRDCAGPVALRRRS